MINVANGLRSHSRHQGEQRRSIFCPHPFEPLRFQCGKRSQGCLLVTFEGIEDLAPSAKLAFKILEHEGRLTQSELADEMEVSPRSVRFATSQLESVGAIESHSNPADRRVKIHQLPQEVNGDGE